MIDFDNLRGQWENTLRIERGYTFVDTAPLECHIGYDDKLRRTLLILSRREIKLPPSSKTVEINQRRRKDGRFNLTLSLLSDNETAVFVEMCRDLLAVTEDARDEAEALKRFWYEIKTVMEQAEKVRIQSLEQLSLERVGKLIIYRLAKTAGGGFTLNSLVKELEELLNKNESAAQRFELLLFQTGYVKREEYDEQSYRLAENMTFTVDESFPRLTKNNLPPAIMEASYSLNLRRLKEEFLS